MNLWGASGEFQKLYPNEEITSTNQPTFKSYPVKDTYVRHNSHEAYFRETHFELGRDPPIVKTTLQESYVKPTKTEVTQRQPLPKPQIELGDRGKISEFESTQRNAYVGYKPSKQDAAALANSNMFKETHFSLKVKYLSSHLLRLFRLRRTMYLNQPQTAHLLLTTLSNLKDDK
jgi:hypothetical protein